MYDGTRAYVVDQSTEKLALSGTKLGKSVIDYIKGAPNKFDLESLGVEASSTYKSSFTIFQGTSPVPLRARHPW